jgi:hypothetical protein
MKERAPWLGRARDFLRRHLGRHRRRQRRSIPVRIALAFFAEIRGNLLALL